jgi:hypothetical protein
MEVSMTPRKRKNLRMPGGLETLTITHPHAAGIDVHSEQHWVYVPSIKAQLEGFAVGISAVEPTGQRSHFA